MYYLHVFGRLGINNHNEIATITWQRWTIKSKQLAYDDFAVVWYKLEKKQKNLMICLLAGGLAVSTVYTALPIIKLLNPAFEGLAYQSSWLAVCLVNIRMMAGQLGNITNIYFPTGPFYYYEVWTSCICARARIIWDILNSIFCGVPLSAPCLSTILAELK